MPGRPGAPESPILTVEGTSTRLVGRDDVFRRIHNMYPTEEGGLRSIDGPMPFIVNYDGTNATVPTSSDVSGSTDPTGAVIGILGSGVTYGVTRGIFHANVGERELLLLHVDNQIWEWTGWNRGYRILVGTESSNPLLTMNLWEPLISDFPTQFVRTPRSVIVIPSGGGRAIEYDGKVCLRLGYSYRPGPPQGLGPTSSGLKLLPVLGVRKTGVNDLGYAVDGLATDPYTGMPGVFKYGRLGTVQSLPVVSNGDPSDFSHVSGFLLPGRYRARQQWINAFGDLSPWSNDSNDIHFDRQPSVQWVIDSNLAYSGTSLEWTNLDAVRKQVAWLCDPGPDGTIYRNIARTRDIEGKGDTSFYVVPRDASANANSVATIPDNVSTFFPDNIPDEWLYLSIEEIEPVPHFRLAELFNSRLFVANSYAEPGAVWVSMVGRYGTFLSKLKFFPDPEGAEVTGLKRVEAGLLAFSRSATYMIVPNDAGDDYRSFTLDANIGCVAPSSISTLRNGGTTIWLGRDGFYAYDMAGGVRFIFADHRQDALLFNRGAMHRSVAAFDPASGEYRCWVPTGSSLVPDVCWCFDGRGWRTRDDVKATGVTVTNDHRNMMLTCGQVTVSATERHGVWVLDRAGEVQEGVLESAWIHASRSTDRASFRRLKLLLRETEVRTADADKLSVTFYRDYRKDTIADGPVYRNLYPAEGTPMRPKGSAEPEVWGGTTWNAATFRTRRPFWVNVDFDVSSAEVFQFVVTSTSRFEILAFAFEEQARSSGSAQGYT